MAEMEKEMLIEIGLDGNESSNDNIRFKLISPHELDRQDVLAAHHKVYGREKQIGKDFLSVAFSLNPEDSTILPRGLTIYPKKPIKPESSRINFHLLESLLRCAQLSFIVPRWKRLMRFTNIENGQLKHRSHRMKNESGMI
ncbi:hypothetical protein CRE_05072 [Caenorhabditis remanei]|uniref:Uncharacterized protein n=1 Tax=Caenorhabditis remanei TaxID=31234 RepID=E3MZ18_CAERE|nr:hypothetical protein CRE_05072 [Caenorhabditis remanei]